MVNRIRFVLPLIVFLILIVALKYGLLRDPNLLPSLLIGKSAPSFSSPSLENKQILITDQQFKGHVTLLNVWATWCNGCQVEHPLLIDLSKQNSLQILGLNYKDKRDTALQYLAKFGNPYQNVIYDPTGSLAMQWGVYGTPETFLIDQQGVVRYRYVGPMTIDLVEKDLLPRIKTLLQKDNV